MPENSSNRPQRKGASRRADIPPDVLRALNEGRDETVTLVEWLAIDMSVLMRSVAPQVGLAEESHILGTAADNLADKGITVRLKGMGAALFEVMKSRRDREGVFEKLASHRSDMVRSWAAYALCADDEISLRDRLQMTRRFAADSAMSVREIAWDSYRPYVAANLDEGLKLLEPWVHDSDPNIRRCAVEGTRPRGVWTAHISALKQDPSAGLPLLEPVRSDSSRYVQNAVANWLNDASKSHPDWVKEVTARWAESSRTKETAYITNRALRTIRKSGSDK